MERSDRAWLAGLLEGEGYFQTRPDKRSNALAVTVGMTTTDLDVLEKVVEITQLGSIKPKKETRPNHKPVWEWRAHGGSAATLALAVFPWLRARRKNQVALLLRAYACARARRARA